MLKKVSLQKDFVDSYTEVLKAAIRYVKKVRKLYNARYKSNHKHDPKIIYII